MVDLGVYELHENYGDLFLPLTANSKESIFLIPRSIEFGVKINIRGPYLVIMVVGNADTYMGSICIVCLYGWTTN